MKKPSKAFWDEVHKEAVEFRNKKRKEYVQGKLTKCEEELTERWDCEPSLEVIKAAHKLKVNPPRRMHYVLLREEPLSIDIQIKAKEKK